MARKTNTSTSTTLDFDNAAAALQRWLPPDHVQALQQTMTCAEADSVSGRATLIFSSVAQAPVSTLEQVQAMLDSVFRPLAKYATCEASIAQLLNTIGFLVQSGSEDTKKKRRAAFATRGALEDIYSPVVGQIKDPALCHLCLKLLYEFSSDPDCRAVFATADARDRILIPLAQYTTTEDSTYGLFVVIKNLTLDKDPERRAVFGTAAVRDRIFLAKVSFVTTHRCVAVFLNTLWLIMGKFVDDDGAAAYTHAALFNTQAVRDMMFLPLVRYLTGETLLLYFMCLHGVVHEEVIENTVSIFGTKSVRDRLFVPLVKYVTSDELAEPFLITLGMIACDCPDDSLWFTTTTLRDRVILPLANFCSAPAIAPRFTWLFRTIMRGPATIVPLHTAKVRDDVLIPLTRQMVANAQARDHQEELGVLCNIVADVAVSGTPPNAHPSTVFATAAVRDEIVIPLAKAMTDMSGRLFRMIDFCQRGSSRRVFATPTVRDELFCRHAASVARPIAVWNALTALMANDVEQAMFATARVRDDVLVPLFKHVPIEYYCSLIREFRDVPLADVLATETRSFMNEVLIALADKCTTAEGAARLAMAMAEL